MVHLARAAKRDFLVRRTAAQIVADVPQKAWMAQVRAVHAYVRDHIKYLRDINGIETLHTPRKMIEYGQGDCDDKALLAAALLETLGHPCRFVAVGQQPGQFEHVLVETQVGKKWVPVETTEPVPVGWYPVGYPYRMVYYI